MVVIPDGRQAEIVPLRLVWSRASGWDRWRRRLRVMVAHERFRESVVVALTFVLVGVLLAGLHHASEALQLAGPAAHYPIASPLVGG